MKQSANHQKITLACTLLIGGWGLTQPSKPASFGFVELLIGARALYGGKKLYETRIDRKKRKYLVTGKNKNTKH